VASGRDRSILYKKIKINRRIDRADLQCVDKKTAHTQIHLSGRLSAAVGRLASTLFGILAVFAIIGQSFKTISNIDPIIRMFQFEQFSAVSYCTLSR
jgi:hypothetical protein